MLIARQHHPFVSPLLQGPGALDGALPKANSGASGDRRLAAVSKPAAPQACWPSAQGVANAPIFQDDFDTSVASVGTGPAAGRLLTTTHRPLADLYQRLSVSIPDAKARAEAAQFLQQHIALLDGLPAQDGECPDTPQDLMQWMQHSGQLATTRYQAYLEGRKNGAPRQYFSNRAHAFYALRALSPTKLVDGAWLYGLVRYWENPRYTDLIRIYLEELGDGQADKNHVVLYRALLSRYGLEVGEALADDGYAQGVLQLALAWNAEDYLPEILGFNLGYEQLPLHLLITAYELNELGIDPYYFTLHVTVDNAQTGHALRAVRAVQEAMPRLRHDAAFWKRVQLGCRLSSAGTGTVEVIESFDIDQEVMRIFSSKGESGRGMHSDYCKVEGRTINEWLARPDDTPGLISALVKKGWICLGEPVEKSRFWHLLQGPNAEMFGVFSPYELQVIHDWIRGAASRDGAAYTAAGGSATPARQPSFRVQHMRDQRRSSAAESVEQDQPPMLGQLDPDLHMMARVLPELDAREQTHLLVAAMSPSEHWTPAGLYATRQFVARL